MDAEQAAVVLQGAQDAQNVAVREVHAPPLVRHEPLERAYASLANLRNDAFEVGQIAADQATVQAEVDHRVLGAFIDEVVDGVPEIAFHAPGLDRTDVGDKGRHATVDGGSRKRIQPVGVDRVQMRLDNPGQDEFSGGIDGSGGGPGSSLVAPRPLDTVDDPIADEDIRQSQFGTVDQYAALDVNV